MLVSFQGQDKAVTQGSKVLRKKYYRPAGAWRFFAKPEGHDLATLKGGGHTFALKKRGPAYGSLSTNKVEGMITVKRKGKRDMLFPTPGYRYTLLTIRRAYQCL